jgi:dTDP-4-amino-4,6-dideoxygalactose transaminase
MHGLAGMFVAGRKIRQLEAEIRDYFGVRHVFCLSSGKAALTLILVALKHLSPRRQVLIPAYTCFSVPSAIVKAGLNVLLCDVNPMSLDFNFDDLEQTVDEKVLCVVPTHLLGLPSDVDRVKTVCKGKGVFVIEDVAQAMGVKHNGRLLGSQGDVGFLSLGRGKNITCGSGGIILTDSDAIAQAIQAEYAKIKEAPLTEVVINWCHALAMGTLINPWLYWLPAGLPFLKLGETKFFRDFPIHRMDGVRARLLSGWKRRLNESNRSRWIHVQEFLSRPSFGYVVKSPVCQEPVYLRLPVLLPSKQAKEGVCALSKQYGLGISPLYPTAIQDIPDLRGRLRDKELPGAAMVADRLVTVPIHHLVGQKDYDKLHDALENLKEFTAHDGPRLMSRTATGKC